MLPILVRIAIPVGCVIASAILRDIARKSSDPRAKVACELGSLGLGLMQGLSGRRR